MLRSSYKPKSSIPQNHSLLSSQAGLIPKPPGNLRYKYNFSDMNGDITTSFCSCIPQLY